MSSVRRLSDNKNVHRKYTAVVKPLIKINSTFQESVSCKSDLRAAHLPALIVSTSKFGSTGQLASLQCQLSFPEAACSILSVGSEPVEVQSTGYMGGLSLAHFLSMSVFISL